MDELNEKLQAQQTYAKNQCGEAVTPTRAHYTLKEEAGKACEHHSKQAQKFAAAHAFLTAHPEFDEFIRLIRNGSLQF